MDEYAKQEAIEFSDFVGQQGVLNVLHADNKRYWVKMVGNGKFTTEQLYTLFIQQKNKGGENVPRDTVS